MTNTLVTTAGTSLTRHPHFSDPDFLKRLLDTPDPLNDRSCGAEINSMTSIIRKGFLKQRENLYLLVSDTDGGRHTGELLKTYYVQSKEFSFARCSSIVVAGLRDDDPFTFQSEGLRSFVRALAEIYSRHIGSLLINATAGYKALTALATAFGQALGVPVCYRFETFEHVITFPPLPMTLDTELWINYRDFFELLETRGTLTERELDLELAGGFKYEELSRSIRILIDRERLEGEKLYALNAMGELFVQAARLGLSSLEIVDLKSSDVPVNRRFSYGGKEGHSISFIKAHRSTLDKVIELPFVQSVRVTGFSDKFDKPFARASVAEEVIKLDLGRKGGTLHMEIRTTAKNEPELRKAVEEILNLTS